MLNVKQAAKRLGITPRRVYDFINDGRLETTERPEGVRYGLFIKLTPLEMSRRLRFLKRRGATTHEAKPFPLARNSVINNFV